MAATGPALGVGVGADDRGQADLAGPLHRGVENGQRERVLGVVEDDGPGARLDERFGEDAAHAAARGDRVHVLGGHAQAPGAPGDHAQVDVLGGEEDVDVEPGGQLVGEQGQPEGLGAAEVGLRVDDEERSGDGLRRCCAHGPAFPCVQKVA